MLDHLVGLLLRALIAQVTGTKPLQVQVEQKLAVLRDAFGPEGSVRAACERHDVGSGSIYTWRRQAMSGELTGVRKPIEPVLAEVQISEPPALPAPLVSSPISSSIGIDLPSGIRVTVDATVDADALSRVIGILTR
ncbi:transposase [Paracoccus pantotrophus]|uniref:transposase n=1 Tax=Alphaproteobacteria TaxID=28211 RepID=UPI001C54C4C0|nr:transposase [Paracoccus pantotrophus]